MTQNDTPLEVAVIGVGRMGRHHARIYRQLPRAKLVAVVDHDPDRAGAVADEYRCAAYTTVEQLLNGHPRLAAASIAVPTALHADAAGPLLQRKIACLIEKPLAPTVAEARQLADLAERCGTLLQVGHTERFNPAVQAVISIGIKPRFIEVDRVSPMRFRSLDIGVVMDMMIHDLDIVLTLAGSPLRQIDATGVAVLGEHEDVANARLVFASGCVANLTASRLALKTQRKLRLVSEDAYVSLDYAQRNGIVIRKSDNAQSLENLRQQLAAGADLADVDYTGIVKIDQLTMDADDAQHDPLTAQLTSFVEAVRHGDRPTVDAAAGYAAVDAAERVVAAIRDHKWEGLTSVRV